MSRPQAPAPRLPRWVHGGLLALTVAALGGSARADVVANPCSLARARGADSSCVACEADPSAPERCRDEYAAKGFAQRCLADSDDEGGWTEIWCLAEVDEPEPAPPAEPLRPAEPVAATLREPAAAEAASAPAEAPASTPPSCGGCRLDAPPSPPSLLWLGLAALWIGGRRRRAR